jgi:hypothetical protein
LKKAHKPCIPGLDNKRGSIRGYYPTLSKTEPVAINKPRVRPVLRPDGYESQTTSSSQGTSNVRTLLGFFENGHTDPRFKDNLTIRRNKPENGFVGPEVIPEPAVPTVTHNQPDLIQPVETTLETASPTVEKEGTQTDPNIAPSKTSNEDIVENQSTATIEPEDDTPTHTLSKEIQVVDIIDNTRNEEIEVNFLPIKDVQPPVRRSSSFGSSNEKYQHDLLELKYQMEKKQLEIEQQSDFEDISNRKEELEKSKVPKPETPVLRRTRSEGGEKMSSSTEQAKKQPDNEKEYSPHISEFARVETRQKSFSVAAPGGLSRAEAIFDNKDNLITQFSYAFARGEKKQAKKKILKLLGKVSTRTALFNSVDQYGKTSLLRFDE